MYKCNFCSYEHRKQNSITVHIKACRLNPKRIPGKNQFSYGATISEETKEKQRKTKKNKEKHHHNISIHKKLKIEFLNIELNF